MKTQKLDGVIHNSIRSFIQHSVRDRVDCYVKGSMGGFMIGHVWNTVYRSARRSVYNFVIILLRYRK